MKLRRFIAGLIAMLVLAMAPGIAGAETPAPEDMPYYITVDVTNQIVTVYATKDNSIVRQMLCSTGLHDSTPLGTFILPKGNRFTDRKTWYYFKKYNVYAQYATRIINGVLFHSIPCRGKSEKSISKVALAEYGRPASHGCIRMLAPDAKFIAQNCLTGTKVVIYKSLDQDEDLRQLLYHQSYTLESGISYSQFLGIPEEDGVLGRYSIGPEVRNLQYRLRDLGFYNGEVTGEYRVDTINAVRQAQEAMGLEPTGLASLSFQEDIYSPDAPTARNVTLQPGFSGECVRNLQNALKVLKLYEGEVDGVYDQDVMESVMVLQNAYGYSSDGIATGEVQTAAYFESVKVSTLFAEHPDYEVEIASDKLYMGRITSQVGVGIRIREKPDMDSNPLIRLEDGELVVGVQRGDGWSRVRAGSYVGYLKNCFVRFFKQDISVLKYTEPTGQVNYNVGHTAQEYYQEAEIPSEQLSEYMAGEAALENYMGFAMYARVNTPSEDVSLNLRQSPSTTAEVLDSLPSGTEMRVLLRSGDWSLVDLDGERGYLMNRYLEFWMVAEEGADVAPYDDEDEATVVEEIDDGASSAVVRCDGAAKAEVYDSYGEDAVLLGHLPNGTQVEIVDDGDEWSLITYEGHNGYMRTEDLDIPTAGGDDRQV